MSNSAFLDSGGSPEGVRPALPAWLWRGGRLQFFDSWDEKTSERAGVAEVLASSEELLVTTHQNDLYANFSAPNDRHALAALCLYGTPNGFTHEDVGLLYDVVERADRLGLLNDPRPELQSLAARLAALLPPPSSSP